MKCEYCHKKTEMEAHRLLGVICEDCYDKEANRRSRFDRQMDEVA